MLISSYNPAAMGDVLVVITAADVLNQQTEIKGEIVAFSDQETGTLLGYNFFQISKLLPELEGNGQVQLTAEQVDRLNQALETAGFDAMLTVDLEPKMVVGYVQTTTLHPDSDHLLITTTQISADPQDTVTIVSGSPNMQAEIKVVVALTGAMMPDGLIIWPGKLRGVESNGMICSGHELELKNAPTKKGALILPTDFAPTGTPFDFEKGNQLFK